MIPQRLLPTFEFIISPPPIIFNNPLLAKLNWLDYYRNNGRYVEQVQARRYACMQTNGGVPSSSKIYGTKIANIEKRRASPQKDTG
jgi:hypothetical protein